jgi:hypothetical protein
VTQPRSSTGVKARLPLASALLIACELSFLAEADFEEHQEQASGEPS